MDDIVEHFTRFAAERRKMRGIDPNEVCSIHIGDPREISITLADLERAVATIAALRSALAECADDLELEIRGRHGSVPVAQYPDMLKKFDRDMAPVLRARALLDTATTERTTS